VSVASSPRGRERGTALAGVSLVLRRVRAEPGPALTMLVLIAGTCFLFAALPRLFNRFADDGLRYTLTRAPLQARNVRAFEPGRLDPGGAADPLAAVAARAESSQQALPASLRELIDRRTFIVHSPRYALQPGAQSAPNVPGLFRFLNLRVQSDVRPHIRLVDGNFPSSSTVRVHTVDRRIPELPVAKDVPLLQVALSTATARQLRLHVGERALFWPDPTNIDVQYLPTHDQEPLAVEVTGLFAVRDPSAPFWFDDPRLDTPEVQLSLEATLVFGQALVSADEYPTMLAATRTLPLEYEFRYYLDTERADAGRLESLSAAAARIETRYAGAGPLERRVEIGLGSVLDRYRAARSQAETLLAVAAIGLLACALANLGLLGALSYDRRRRETGVSRTRGASPLQMLAAQAAEGVLIAAPAALTGWAVAVLAIRARGSSLSGWLAVAIVTGTVLLLVAAIAGVARGSPTPAGRDDIVLARLSRRRLALEGLVVVAAGLGVYLLRRRGLDASGPGAARGFDPYLAGVPVLLGLACGIGALRLYPFPVAAAARLARRGRGLAIHFGLSRAARQPEITFAPLLVLVLALAIASFSAGMLSTIEKGQNRTSWRAVGADVRIDAAADESLPAHLVSLLDSIGDVAPAYVQDAGTGTEGEATLLIALDLPAYERVVAGTPAAVAFPRALRKPPPILGAVPAVVSTDWPGAGFSLVTLPTQTVSLVSVAERTSLPGVPRGTPFAVVPLQALRQVAGPLVPNRVYLRGASVTAVRQAVRDSAPRAEIASRAAIVRGLRASPLVDSVLSGFRSAFFLAALYAAVAVGLMALIAARSRSRDLALIRTMGGSRREALALATVELAPFVAVVLGLGIGLGIAVLYLIAPGLDLAFFTGNVSSATSISWTAAAAFAVGLLALVGAAVVLVGIRAQRADLDRVLRIGER
jgi:putative ABC transport system permease protein